MPCLRSLWAPAVIADEEARLARHEQRLRATQLAVFHRHATLASHMRSRHVVRGGAHRRICWRQNASGLEG
jgi:hypothetical protein